MYAERKDWPLDEVKVNLEVEESHREDCDDCEESFRQVTTIRVQVNVDGDLTSEQRDRLGEIAEKCPVRRTLEGSIDVTETEVSEPA
jgi:uncharacterized OsmC-like protein